MKPGKSFVKFLLPILVSGILIIPKEAKSIGVGGFVHNSYNGVPGANSLVKVYRKPTGTIDTLFATVDSNDGWAILTENFDPPAQLWDTLRIEAWKDTLGRKFYSRTDWVIRSGSYPDHNFVRELHLDDPWKSPLAFTPNISVVKDTSGISTSFVALAALYKNLSQPCIGVVDTALSLTHRYDAYFNLEFQDSMFAHGDSFKVRLEKTRNDTTWFTEIASAIDTTHWDAMVVNANNSVHNGAFHGDTLYFPQSFSVFREIGLEKIIAPDTADSGQVIVPGVVVRNYGTINQNPWLHCKINEFYHDSMNVVAQPGIDTFYFSPCTLNQVGNWLVTSYSVLPGDVNSSNDTLQKTITVNSVGIAEEKGNGKGLENRVGFEIYPSLGNGMFNVKGCRGKISVYDATGRKVNGYEANATGSYDFDVPSGIYFVKSGDKTKKVIKVK
ncbi:MAG: T9SS type A sorting domain-containing protein [Candidatus Pacearchaeota archaeon]